MSEISSFVFFDIEATGLRCVDPPKITEIAFTACSRKHLLEANENEIPRALYKLLVPVNPMKVIHPESTKITGLDNFLLEDLNKLDANTVNLMKSFFNQLSKPVCLVAHNGNGYDYPILKYHLNKLDCLLDEDLMCADSLVIFKKIDELKTTSTAIEEFLNTDLKDIQQRNEKTPSKEKSFAVISKPYKKPSAAKCLFDTPTTPRTPSLSSSSSTSTSITTNSSIVSTAPVPNSQSPGRKSYKLVEIFKRLYGREPDIAHNAEADTLHLLRCVIATKDEFVQLADSMATKFIDIK